MSLRSHIHLHTAAAGSTSSVTPPANITIRPGTAADADAISQVHYEALDQFHDFYGAFFKKHPRELVPVFYVAEEEGQGVVGFVRYCIEEANDGDEEEKKKNKEEVKTDGKKEEEKKEPYACKEELKGVWKAFNDAQAKRDEMQENAVRGQRHMWIQHVMIRPSHQRRGIGHALLSTALQQADDEMIPTVIVSSAESVGLYIKVGFVSLGSFRIDNGHWAREAARVQPGQESEMLVERYDGVFEVEDVMVRTVGERQW